MKLFSILTLMVFSVLMVACNEKDTTANQQSSYANTAAAGKTCEYYPTCAARCNQQFPQPAAGSTAADPVTQRNSCLHATYTGGKAIADSDTISALLDSGLTAVASYPDLNSSSDELRAEFSAKAAEGVYVVCDQAGSCSQFVGGSAAASDRAPASL